MQPSVSTTRSNMFLLFSNDVEGEFSEVQRSLIWAMCLVADVARVAASYNSAGLTSSALLKGGSAYGTEHGTK
jgi:hypothetical protein